MIVNVMILFIFSFFLVLNKICVIRAFAKCDEVLQAFDLFFLLICRQDLHCYLLHQLTIISIKLSGSSNNGL